MTAVVAMDPIALFNVPQDLLIFFFWPLPKSEAWQPPLLLLDFNISEYEEFDILSKGWKSLFSRKSLQLFPIKLSLFSR